MIPSNSAKSPFYGTPPRSANPSPVGTPTGTPRASDSRAASVLAPRISETLERVIPGLDANRLFQSLDRLFGNRGEYTLAGSACMHIHAMEHSQESSPPLPLPNDLDVVVTGRGIGKLDLAGERQLNALNLRRDEHLPHVLYMTRPNHGDLKIDVVKDRTPGFAKYTAHPHEVDDIQIGQLDHCLNDYRQRLQDPDFIQACGGKQQAQDKIKPWLDFFSPPAAGGPPNTEAGSPQHKRRRLFEE